MPSHSHRPGPLRQTNKRNKRSKASKRSLNRGAGGRINAKLNASRRTVAKSKADRRHMIQQKRKASREAILQKRRGLDGSAPPPRVVGVISLGQEQDIETRLIEMLLSDADKVVREEKNATITAKYNAHKKDGTLTFLANSKAFTPHYGAEIDGQVMAAMDLCRTCDVVLFVIDGNGPNPDEDNIVGMSINTDERSVGTSKSVKSHFSQAWDHLISERGDRIISALKAQGLPTPVTILAKTAEDEEGEDYMTMKSAKSARRATLKRGLNLRKYVGRFATTEFGVDNDKVVEVNLTESMERTSAEEKDDMEYRQKRSSSAALVRTLCTMAASPPKWVSQAPRSYMLADKHVFDNKAQELMLTGHLRGKAPFNVNSLVHVPNLGTFACKAIRKETHKLKIHRPGQSVMEMDVGDMLVADPSQRESLEMFADANALDGEQNLVGFDEREEDQFDEEDEAAVARPTGWSDYQSSWLDAVDNLGDGDEVDHGELARELNQRNESSGASVATGVMDLDEDHDYSPEERNALLKQRSVDQTDDMEFPDEVEVEMDVKARDRFARYRSLKSFRKSHWDPKENLPETYASIFNFRSFRATQREVFADMRYVLDAATECKGKFWGSTPGRDESMNTNSDSDSDVDDLEGCIPSGSYVTVVLEGVSAKQYSQISEHGVVAAASLLPHENKVSVLHMGLSHTTQCAQLDIPVKSKDILTFRCGWRTWKARPVFSQNNLNSDKHKFERFLPQGGAFFAASCFGPVTYSPCPVMLFRQGTQSQRELLAVGSMLPADADRIVVKRIILTGYPTRVHKRHATVKYMFFNPDDVRWFKPAGLVTKHGLNGHIIESVGEHGTMKCLFNAPIKQHDTVCLPLYKRIYPKFANTAPARDDGVSVRSCVDREALRVL